MHNEMLLYEMNNGRILELTDGEYRGAYAGRQRRRQRQERQNFYEQNTVRLHRSLQRIIYKESC